MERVIAYIDGFNLYFALKNKNWKRYYWLDLPALAQNLLKKDKQTLIATKYFTARVTSLEKAKRQTAFIDALRARGQTDIHFGFHRHEQKFCTRCQQYVAIPTEKMTDVAIAVEMLNDAYQNAFDTAMLFGGDTDLVPSIQKIKKVFPDKRIVVAFPPDRVNDDLRNVASAHFVIGRAIIAKSLLPQKVEQPSGFVLECPDTWK